MPQMKGLQQCKTESCVEVQNAHVPEETTEFPFHPIETNCRSKVTDARPCFMYLEKSKRVGERQEVIAKLLSLWTKPEHSAGSLEPSCQSFLLSELEYWQQMNFSLTGGFQFLLLLARAVCTAVNALELGCCFHSRHGLTTPRLISSELGFTPAPL